MAEPIDPSSFREIINFQMSYTRRHIKATWCLAILIVFMFILEESYGGSQNTAVLVRMGANLGQKVKEGEYYRIFSSVFLHAGLMHVFFNTYVLFALGGFFNRILGESRYLTVFFISGIGGSLASIFLGKSQVSVGASGAIWGLFGASLALAVFKTALLPEAIRLRLRRVTFINLVINLGVSFLPMIDMWAHIGGGITGFLVSLLIIFPPKTAGWLRFTNYCFNLVAGLLALLYIISIVFALWTFKPWADPLRSDLSPRQLSEVALTVAMPEHLSLKVMPNTTAHDAVYLFGDPLLDEVLIQLQVFDSIGRPADDAWLLSERQNLLANSEVGADIKKSLYLKTTAEGSVLYYEQSAKNGDRSIHNYVITLKGYALKFSLIASEKISRQKADRLADKIIAEARALNKI